jgi:hypothetical protein
VTIKSHKKGEPLREAKWLVLNASGFETEGAAQEFGEQLRQIVEIVALCVRLGVDVGQDRPTGWINEEWARSIGMIEPHERLMPNVHGLMVIPDDDLTRIMLLEAEAMVTADPAQVLTGINGLGRQMPIQLANSVTGVRILNLALMSQEPLTQVVLALSAVEALGQGETWTERQRALLSELADQVDRGSDAEQQEVAEALKRSVHRIGLRQGVMRVLSRLGLSHLRKEWDRLYSLRSGVFHGTAHLTEQETHELARAAITLCGTIVLAVAQRDGIQVPAIAKTHFPG